MSRILLNEGKAVLRMFAHQPLDEIAHPGAFLIFLGQGNADHTAGLRVHGGFAELLRVHFAKALEPIDLHLLARSEEHTSELQSLMRISYAVFCLKKKKK